ncbi:rhodanese-related sulfurtransferase [Prolixibacteraceae bacterium JC049]|nr:rhodanese-related sulfurtransferase [Prolixibacteraceae bacterium JC049]
MELYNKVDRKILMERLQNEPFQRKTISFYRYVIIDNPQEFRDKLYQKWNALQCFGRIYVAHEGINAQMSIPEHHVDQFLNELNATTGLQNMPIKWAVEDDGKSFYKLTIKVRSKIVADGLNDKAFDVTNVGKHLNALEFHELIGQSDTIAIDMRNHYESEIGHFQGAVCPDVDTFREELDFVTENYADQKDKKVLLYCTGGVRCEKASAWLKHNGFQDVNQLHGGIIEYARQIKANNLQSKFIGKNFVFDQRLGESIDGQIISKCHQCGEPCDTHTNCANDDCHLLFIQCEKCKEKHRGCCTPECTSIIDLPTEERKKLRISYQKKYADSTIYKSRLRPKLKIEA